MKALPFKTRKVLIDDERMLFHSHSLFFLKRVPSGGDDSAAIKEAGFLGGDGGNNMTVNSKTEQIFNVTNKNINFLMIWRIFNRIIHEINN